MKTKTKLAFIDQNGSKLTIYPIKPIGEKVNEFRKQQLSTIKKEDRIYRAFARETGTWHETHYLDDDRISMLKDDTFPSYVLGYENPYDTSISATYEYWNNDPKHILKRSSHGEQWDDVVKSYLAGGMNSVPFRVNTTNKDGEIHNFLPLERYIGSSMVDSSGHYAVMRGILHLPFLAYLEQLLRCNSIGILATRTAKVDGSLEKILDLFSFLEPQSIDIDKVKESEELIQQSNRLLYGNKTFHREVPLDPLQTEKERRPISQDFLEQVQIDKPLIERVKKYIKTK